MAVFTTGKKQEFLATVQEMMNTLGTLRDRAAGVVQSYTDRGYDPNAEDPITAAQLENFGVIPYDLGAAMDTLTQVRNLLAGVDVPTHAVYGVTVNKWRKV
jgi:hypothetical protein